MFSRQKQIEMSFNVKIRMFMRYVKNFLKEEKLYYCLVLNNIEFKSKYEILVKNLK